MTEQPWQRIFGDYSSSSFIDFLQREHTHLMPRPSGQSRGEVSEVPHGTTVLAMRYREGVVMAGDRQATSGYQVASRRIDKIFKSDDLSGVGIAGAAGPAMEMAKLFQTELEHYEKVEGDGLKVLNFHPIHVFINSESESRYATAKRNYQDVGWLRSTRNASGPGIGDVLDGLLQWVRAHRIP